MANIYENTHITIAATCCANSDRGISSRTRDDMMAMPIPHTGLFVRRRKPKFPIGACDDHPRRNPWPLLSRAWVYQELRLSPNFIHLAKEQLYWECNTCLISEDGSESYYSQELPGTYTHGFKMGSSDPELDWRKVVERCSRLDM
jgi:hypothetical protein